MSSLAMSALPVSSQPVPSLEKTKPAQTALLIAGQPAPSFVKIESEPVPSLEKTEVAQTALSIAGQSTPSLEKTKSARTALSIASQPAPSMEKTKSVQTALPLPSQLAPRPVGPEWPSCCPSSHSPSKRRLSRRSPNRRSVVPLSCRQHRTWQPCVVARPLTVLDQVLFLQPKPQPLPTYQCPQPNLGQHSRLS
jgi:hypothetical protein